MYDRFSDRAKKVMQLANREAQSLNAIHIDAEHIFWALIAEECRAVALLRHLNIDPENLRTDVRKLMSRGVDVITMGRLPQSLHAKRVLEWAREEAKDLNSTYVGTEHLLLAFLRLRNHPLLCVLENFGLFLEGARTAVRQGIEFQEPVPLLRPMNGSVYLYERFSDQPGSLKEALKEITDLGGKMTIKSILVIGEKPEET